jgi:hypothetical protein
VKVRTSLWPVVALAAGICGLVLVASHLRPHAVSIASGGMDGARYGIDSQAATSARLPVLPQPRPLQFVESTATGDRQAVLTAIAEARPEARRLLERVAGLVTVSVGALENGVAGRTTTTSRGYDVTLDLGAVSRAFGKRGIARVTLHELGHVVDSALVPRAVERELDAAIPAGWGCENGKYGSCADRAERFAESFAKWATGDIGVDIYLGYSVPPPVPLATWGAPLGALAP